MRYSLADLQTLLGQGTMRETNRDPDLDREKEEAVPDFNLGTAGWTSDEAGRLTYVGLLLRRERSVSLYPTSSLFAVPAISGTGR
jgi:hypothetical protein